MVGTTGTPKARTLGAELRDARNHAGVGVRELARRLGVSHTALSRYESGQRVPAPEDVASILTALGINGERRQEMVELSRNPGGSHWLAIGMPERERQLGALLEFELEATSITDVSPLLIPGLLQTADYARAIMIAADVPSREVETRVAVRIGRREALTRARPAHLLALISEASLRHSIGGPQVMAAQLRYLATMAQLPAVTLRVIPSDCGWHPGLEGPFVLVEFEKAAPIVHLENRRSGLFLHEAADTAAYRAAADKVAAAAMSPADSSRLIEKIADTTAGATR
ncbi:MAG: helix-turn-helix domain-containing protein [Sciscionella sp.]